MDKQVFFFIDDVIWAFRDITRKKPASLFDNEFFKMLKKAHDENGMAVQLNLFYRTDFFYGSDEFTLAETTDAYKKEFEEASSWLKLGFHAKQEFPDYPYINASYEDAKKDYTDIVNEIKRFAGEKSVSDVVTIHWGAMSKEGCRALKECGVRILSCSYGVASEYNGDPSILPYGHAARLLQNRKPETKLFIRETKDASIRSSICSYNYITQQQFDKSLGKNVSYLDDYTGLGFRKLGYGPCLNHHTQESLLEGLDKINGNDYIGLATHEQYFYPDYYAYQPDYPEKIYLMSKTLNSYGYRFITAEEMK